MWTARDVQERLRREMGFDRLAVKLADGLRPEDAYRPGRWVVCVRVRDLTGRRNWPMTMLSDGTFYPGGSTTIREVSTRDEVVYVHEGPDGEYLELEPSVIRRELERRDTHHRDLAAEFRANVARKRADQKKALDDDVEQRTKYYRKAFARYARGEDTGLFR